LALNGHDDIIGGLTFSSDGSMLAARSGSEVRIWALDIDDLLEIARRSRER
jgi:WD40 repeat protein